MTVPRLFIFARYPEPGRAKTRLIPALGAEGAATLYRRLLQHTVHIARESGLDFEVRITGAPEEAFARLLGGELAFADQGAGSLGERLARVPAPAIVIGSDAPALTPAILQEARDSVEAGLVAIGPASDGGYYLLGLPREMPFLFCQMPWSTSDVLPETKRRLAEEREQVAMLPELVDIDDPADLAVCREFLR